MSSWSDVWGKTSGLSLSKHTDDCKQILGYIVDNQEEVIRNWCDRNNIDYERLIKDLEFIIHYHDFGKATKKWQENARLIAKGEYIDLPIHAAYSGYLMANDERIKSLTTDEEFIPQVIPLLVCNSHHSLLTNASWEKAPLLDIKDVDLRYLQRYNQESGYKEIDITLRWQRYLETLRMFRRHSQNDKLRRIDGSGPINSHYKARYSLILSLITASDGVASNLEEKGMSKERFKDEIAVLFPRPKDISGKISTMKEEELTEIQKKVINIPHSVESVKPLVIEAPCGEGKTLASLLWAKRLFEEGVINRVIFTLPTQITSNNMANEFATDYGIPKEWVGVYHSELMSFLIDDGENDLEGIKYRNSIYSKPFTISTIDHLLLSLVNGYKFAPRAFGNLQSSLVIIDELHYYDPHTIGMIKCLCVILKDLKIPHIIMSATIPRILKQEFSEYIEIQSSGKDKKGITKSPYNFVFHEKQVLLESAKDAISVSEEFLGLVNKNKEKDIGIIVNTVPKSKQLFEILQKTFPKAQILLYNSEFMRKDRRIKEKLVKILGKRIDKELTKEEVKLCNKYGFDSAKPLIFIGTQVAEISLNISFDIILSDLAPIDALFQRGGRLHRKRTYSNSEQCNCNQCKRFAKKHMYELHVFETGEFCHPYYGKEEETVMRKIIEATRKIIQGNPGFTFEESLRQINNVYSNEKMFEGFDPNTSFWKVYKEDLIFGGKPSKDEEGNLRITTRKIDAMHFEVLPQIFDYNGEKVTSEDFLKKVLSNKEFIKNKKLNKKGINEITRHMLKISNKRYYSNQGNSITLGEKWLIKTVKLDYDFERGLYKDTTII